MSERFTSFDGAQIAFRRVGSGRPVVLLHGLFSSAQVNWIRFGHAQKLADAGFEAIMPDLRAHGESAAPHDPAAYPPDVLVRDLEALVAHLGLTAFDLAGFSLGARTVARAAAAGMNPRRLVIAGMGLDGLTAWEARPSFFLDAIARFDEVRMGDEAYFTVQFMKTMKIDRVAAKLLLEAIGKGGPVDLSRITMRTLVLCGEEDRDNGSPEALAEALPDGHYAAVPGTHMSSVTKPDMGDAIVRFLVD
ncbi:MAG: alpha/beta hydrolase [Candidatus Andeanibacterium colombiense]|uniref:Alpha/beta hydrolase n=1 Tax=Candidatus Andeanibacterium colombiense TaxID=3121345 RepID=A0AAJ6BPL0_9SPHN|nr:MAG: alpha/beta hydrolase [Sphingomonadaceae bacterium]